MSNRDPVFRGLYSPQFRNTNYMMNPAANNFAPTSPQQNGTPSQVSTPSSTGLEARFLNLEEEHATLRADASMLRELYHGLSSSVDKLKKGDWPVHVGPFQEVDVQKSHQSAVEFRTELEKLKEEAQGSLNAGADAQKVNGMTTTKMNGNIPPHLRTPSVASSGTVKNSLPPHLRCKKLESSNGQG
jgi:hypothetical protein